MLKKGLEQLGFAQEEIERISPPLETYISELMGFKEVCNSVLGAETYDDIVSRHIMDSLAPWKILGDMIEQTRERNASSGDAASGDGYKIEFADVGSGPGLPGIPLAIVFPNVHFTLIERMTKRVAFLERAVAVLKLENVSIECVEAERVAQNRFDVVVFRAFHPFEKKIIRVLLRILKEDGKLAAYKATPEKINEEMEAIKQWAPVWEMKPLKVPYLDQNQRHLVVIPKRQNK